MEPSMRERFMLGGRVNFSEGSDFLSVQEIQSLIPDELKDTLKPGAPRGQLLFSPSGIKKAYDRGFKKRFAKIKLGLTYLRELDNELKGLDSFPNSQARVEFIQKFSKLPEVENLLKDTGFKSIQDFQNSKFSRKNYLKQTIDSLLKGEATKGTGRGPGALKTVRTGPIGQVDKIIVNKLLTDVLGDNAQFFINEGSLPNEISLTAQSEGSPELRQRNVILKRYKENLDLGFSNDEARKIYKNQSKTALRTKNLNASLGLTNNTNLRFARTHYFPVYAGGEMKRLNLLADGVNYSEKYTFKPSYTNQIQNTFYDGPIQNAVNKFKRGDIKVKQLASELDTIATKFKRNFPDIEVAELKLNKNNKFDFKKDFPSITNESRFNKIALTRNAINELEKAYVVSTTGAMDDTKFNQLKKDYNFVNEKYRNIFQPVFTQENIEIIRTRPTLRKKILNAAGKGTRIGGKILGPLSVVAGTIAVNTAVKAGERDVFDLAGAYVTATPEVAVINRKLREDEQFAEKYTGTLPEIVSEDVVPMTQEEEIEKIKNLGLSKKDESAIVSAINPEANNQVAGLLEESGSPYMQFLQGGGQLTPEEFNQLQSIPQSDRPLTGELDLPEMDQTMMAAQGGRVGFANGSPSPLESEATIDQALAALNSSEVRKQFLYDTSPVGKLEKNILGKDGDRSLMQSFNTQFLDPRTYPYYAQKTLRGGANIPELSVRFPLAATYLFGKGVLAFENFKRTGDFSKFSMEDVKTAMEILEPKFTNLALEGKLGDVLGLSPKAIQAAEEKRTSPQKTTGSFLQFTGEAVGPATPYVFLAKLFPKLPKQIKDLGGSINAADKINKEIERRAAQDGVDQTRRDILIATGSGGAIALLKYLGLDNLFKAAPKAVKATPEIVTKGGTPKYFFDFVNLIKKKGDDITEKASTLERQKVYDYNGYVLTEDISTGKISIRKDTEGGATYSIGDGEYETVEGIVRKEEINYEPPETILDDKGKSKQVPDSYDEATLKPDSEGDLEDIDQGLDSIDEILDLLAKDGKAYSKEELIKMGLNPETMGTYFRNYKQVKAGGGIVKLAGADSGPPPKSGPTPHGLPYIAKNVRPIKERK